MIVDKVSMALLPLSRGSSDLDQAMSDSKDNEGSASKKEELMEPDDMMTLVQYQSSHRKEHLSRKITQHQSISHKKGRVVTDGDVS